MAVDEGIEAAVMDEIGDDPVMIIDIVHDELTRRAAVPGTAGLAKTALSSFQPRWTIMDTSRCVTIEEVQLAQEDVADGRTLTESVWVSWRLQLLAPARSAGSF